MIAASYLTKKELKAAVGKPLRYIETSMFGAEYLADGTFPIVGPAPLVRKFYATVTMSKGIIAKVT